jgi:methyl-accepting chemotaxis protein
MNLRDFKIGARLRIGFGIILLILVAIVLMTNYLNYSNKSKLTQGWPRRPRRTCKPAP